MKISKIRNVKTPERGTSKSAGLDFFIPIDFKEFIIPPHGDVLIPSGIKANVPEGFALIANNKSGIATKKRLIVGAKVVDEDYQGEIHLHLINTTNTHVTVTPGMKIVQFLLLAVDYRQVEVVDEEELFPELSERGTGGFGSTDK